MEENKTMKIYNLIVLDESGSMSSIYNQALSGINEVINGIRQNQEKYPEQRHFVSIVTFEGEGMSGVKTRRDCVPVGEVADLTKKDYRPGGCTPLYDAMGKAISELDRKVEVGDGVSGDHHHGRNGELLSRIFRKGCQGSCRDAEEEGLDVRLHRR